jgi:hypothetical protein
MGRAIWQQHYISIWYDASHETWLKRQLCKLANIAFLLQQAWLLGEYSLMDSREAKGR